MGGSKVVFDKQAGFNYTKGKKRMRGEIVKGSEVKKWNALYGSSATVNLSYDFVNVLTGYQVGVATAWRPQAIQWPAQGTSLAHRIGNKINFLGIRFKGWITLAPDQLKQIRWRLVLCRLDIPRGNLDFTTVAYLSQFQNADTNVPSSFNVDTFETFCRHNFYKKFKDPTNKDFKMKVIASGCLPATNVYQKMTINMDGSIAGQAAILTTGTRSNYITGLHSGNVGYLPLDVSVAINDTIDCFTNLRQYYVVLEADCGYGWTDQGSASDTQVGLLMNFMSRGYFTDA